MEAKDRRKHNRLQTQLECSMELANQVRSAELRDLSQGGACVLVGGTEPARGEQVQLRLPVDGSAVPIKASVVRSTPMQDGFLVALRFLESNPDRLGAVSNLLGELLASSGGGGREHPRVSHRLRIDTARDMLAVVENISLGGISMNVEKALEVGEDLLVVLPNSEGDDMLSLRARVVNQRPHDAEDGKSWIVGLTFEDLSPQSSMLLNALLVGLLKED